LESGKEKDYHVRVNFVGHLGAGKTSLMLQMLLEKEKFKTFFEQEFKSTNGIEISIGNCCIDLDSKTWYKDINLANGT